MLLLEADDLELDELARSGPEVAAEATAVMLLAIAMALIPVAPLQATVLYWML
jgi:hypothetical protein